MTEKWYDGLNDDAFLKEEDKKYKAILEKIRSAVGTGLGFEEACNTAGIEKNEQNDVIIDDALKVLIVEMHFEKQMPAEEVAAKLKLPVEQVNAARQSMLREIEETAVKTFHKSIETGKQD